MARLKTGLVTIESGSISNLVIVSRNGKTFVRVKPAKRGTPKSMRTRQQNDHFKATYGLLSRFKTMLREYMRLGNGDSGWSRALSINLNRITSEADGLVRLHPNLAFVTAGKLAEPASLRVERTPVSLRIYWSDATRCFEGRALHGGFEGLSYVEGHPTDTIRVILDSGMAATLLPAQAFRSDGMLEIPLAIGTIDRGMALYVFALSASQQEVSFSSYLQVP